LANIPHMPVVEGWASPSRTDQASFRHRELALKKGAQHRGGVEATIWLATLPDGAPAGLFLRDGWPIPFVACGPDTTPRDRLAPGDRNLSDGTRPALLHHGCFMTREW
jgi:hypothetical protein